MVFILNLLKPVVYLRVIFQEIDVFQCVNQEFSRSRKFSFLYNRSVYSDFYYVYDCLMITDREAMLSGTGSHAVVLELDIL